MLKLAPSLLAADFSRLDGDIRRIEEGGAHYLHLDVMDGTFVPSISFGTPVIGKLRSCTKLKFDVHMMVEEPARFAEDYVEAGAELITVHAEACRHLDRTVRQIRSLGVQVGVALNPATSLSALDYILNEVDMILLMSVNPGFANQSYLEHVEKKAARLAAMQETYGYTVMMDGAVNIEAISRLCGKGISAYVLGNRVLLDRERECYAEAVRSIRAVWENMGKGVTT